MNAGYGFGGMIGMGGLVQQSQNGQAQTTDGAQQIANQQMDSTEYNRPWYEPGGWYSGYDVVVKAKVKTDNPMTLQNPDMKYALVGSAHKLKCPECKNSFLLEMKNAEVFC